MNKLIEKGDKINKNAKYSGHILFIHFNEFISEKNSFLSLPAFVQILAKIFL